MNLLLAVSGSVAAIKIPVLLRLLQEDKEASQLDINVKIIATEKALHFFKKEQCGITQVITDEQEWQTWRNIGDPVLHIELCKWADVLVIAPLDANTMAKIANGICDNLLTCVARAWMPSRPVYFAPAMNTYMWEHPITSSHVDKLVRVFHYRQIPPIRKTLACGDTGVGAMAEVKDILEIIKAEAGASQKTPAPTLYPLLFPMAFLFLLFSLFYKPTSQRSP